jgi:carbon monoxide dehydrogenase subunit G
MMQLEVERHERINAPLQLVWEEMDSLEQILAKIPQISDHDVAPGGQKSRGRTKLTWGPVKWAVDVEVAIAEFQPRRRLGFVIDAPTLQVRYECSIDLVSIGERETKLDYRGHLDVRHRMASRVPGLFNEMAEDQAHSLVHRVKVKAEQRRLAQERLLK